MRPIFLLWLAFWLVYRPVAWAQTDSRTTGSKTPGSWSLRLTGTLNRAIGATNSNWTDTQQGVGMNWGVSGGVEYQRPLLPWLNVGASADYTHWQVRRRFLEASTEKFRGDLSMYQVALLGLVRIYPYKTFFMQPMGGGQWLQTVHRYSETYPGRSSDQLNSGFRLAWGGVVGYEFRRGHWLSEVGVTYRHMPNDRFETIEGSLPVIGLRTVVGWQR